MTIGTRTRALAQQPDSHLPSGEPEPAVPSCCRMSHGQRSGNSRPALATKKPDMFEVGEKFEMLDDPVGPPAVSAAAAGGAAAEAGDGGQQAVQRVEAAGAGEDVPMLSARAKELELNEPRMSTLSLFTPWHVVAVGLHIVGIPPPQSDLTAVFCNRKMGAARVEVAPLACKRPRRR